MKGLRAFTNSLPLLRIWQSVRRTSILNRADTYQRDKRENVIGNVKARHMRLFFLALPPTTCYVKNTLHSLPYGCNFLSLYFAYNLQPKGKTRRGECE